jgi:hypothetical protein
MLAASGAAGVLPSFTITVLDADVRYGAERPRRRRSAAAARPIPSQTGIPSVVP